MPFRVPNELEITQTSPPSQGEDHEKYSAGNSTAIRNWVDKGLGGFLEGSAKYAGAASANLGKHKVPTLRNVDLRPSPDFVKAYMHNGFFKDLQAVVHFYNTRDVSPEKWPAPEVSDNLNTTEMGNLGLTAADEAAVVLFMKTLSDRL